MWPLSSLTDAAPPCGTALLGTDIKPVALHPAQRSEFVVNIMSEWFVEAANHCCGNFDYGEDEMELSGLTPLPSIKA